jgi:hypothetical protein
LIDKELREKKDLLAKKRTGIGMKIGKGKHRFIKDDITRYIDSPRTDI